MNILIPMAGLGSRFAKQGYDKPKPLIDVMGKPMIQRVVENIALEGHYIFVIQREHDLKYNLTPFLKTLASQVSVVYLDGLSQGAAETVLAARHLIDNDQPLLIANSDQIQEWNAEDFEQHCTAHQSDGVIVTFHDDSDKNSYVHMNNRGHVIHVAEKEVISNIATTGVYYWRKGSFYCQAAQKMIDKNIRTNNEFYVCPVYNENIALGHRLTTFHIQKHWPIGTPEDLEIYLKAKS